MNILFKYSLLLVSICLIRSIQFKNRKQVNKIDIDDEYGEELNAISNSMSQIDSMNKITPKPEKTFSDIYSKPKKSEVIMNIANLLKCDKSSERSFMKLNEMANNIRGEAEDLRKNFKLKSVLKIILMDRSFKLSCKINAAKLGSRLFDLPITLQNTGKDPNKDSPNRDTFIVMPRVERIYRPDKYIENYKAGNWDA